MQEYLWRAQRAQLEALRVCSPTGIWTIAGEEKVHSHNLGYQETQTEESQTSDQAVLGVVQPHVPMFGDVLVCRRLRRGRVELRQTSGKFTCALNARFSGFLPKRVCV